MTNYSSQTALLVLSWVAASIFALAGLTTLFFGFEGYCHIVENCLVKAYPVSSAAADKAADAADAAEKAVQEAEAEQEAAGQAAAADKAVEARRYAENLQDKVQPGAVTTAAFNEMVKKAFRGNWWEPLITAGLYLVIWLALGFFVFLNGRRLFLLMVFLHVVVIIYAFLAYLLIGNKVAAGDTNVPLIFLIPPVVGGFASVFYLFLREYFLQEQNGLKDTLSLIEKEVQNLVNSLRQIHFLNKRLQEQAPIELVIESGHTSTAVIDHLERVLQGKELNLTADDFNDEESLIAAKLFHSQLAIDKLSRVYPGQVQKLKTDHGSIRQLLQDIDALDTWVDDAKNAIAEGSRQLAEGIDESSRDILSRHPQISHDELLKEFLEEELSLRIDRRIPSINSVDFPWSDKRGSL